MEATQPSFQTYTPTVNGGKTPSKRPKRSLPSLPTVASASDMVTIDYQCKVDGSPVSWGDLNLYSLFSLSTDGSYPHIKVSRSKACDLRTGKSFSVGSGRCYRVVF